MDNSYTTTPILEDFKMVCDLKNYREIPSNWHVIVADVKNSTNVIKAGGYKAVNFIGVSVISSILNIAKSTEIPYIFGGDGAAICIPEDLLPLSRQALLATKQLAHSEFNLDLRIGIVSVKHLQRAGKRVLAARHKVSKFCTQAAFSGGGIEYAEFLLKSSDNYIDILSTEDSESPAADYNGLECRWDNVPSRHGETISLIVKSILPVYQNQSETYMNILLKVTEIYGDDVICRPISKPALSFTFDDKKLGLEAKLKSYNKGRLAFFIQLFKIRLQMILGWVLMNLKIKINGVNWGNYKDDIVLNTDFKKFDGTLRLVISGTAEQRAALEKYLQELLDNNICVYGIHYSDSAFITCLINDRNGDHYHFVDGADGGYALAALQMKKQMANLGL